MLHHANMTALAPWVAAFGLAPGTHIATPHGPRAAGDLAPGDLVLTRDAGPRALTEVRRTVGAPMQRNHLPITLAAGALGFGLPKRDLTLGPQHRVLYENVRIPLFFGEDAVLVRAKSLTVAHRAWTGYSEIAPEYVQLVTERQQIIFAEGVPVETILPEGVCELPFATVRSWELQAAVA